MISTKDTVERYFEGYGEYKCERLVDFLESLKLPTSITKQKGVLMAFVTQGEMEVGAGYERYLAREGNLLIIQPNKPFFLGSHTTDVDGYVLLLKGDGVLGSMGNHSLIFNLEFLETWSDSLFHLEHLPTEFIENIFKRIKWEKDAEGSKLSVVNAYVITLLLEVNQFYNESALSNRASIDITRKFKMEVYNNLNKNLSITEFADRLAVSPNHLNKAVKSVTGESASQLAHKIKMVEAKYRLMMPASNIAEIASELGFSDASYFSRFFKKNASLSPKEYQNTIDLS
ncbi:helix-turn-helix transcriptional regulator [bacterium SCSIO 12741]|nr:helix-turn-helix transcriptional regulator [bacterium SCSIO 12741]